MKLVVFTLFQRTCVTARPTSDAWILDVNAVAFVTMVGDDIYTPSTPRSGVGGV
jgi:hypothetical protein